MLIPSNLRAILSEILNYSTVKATKAASWLINETRKQRDEDRLNNENQ